MKRSPSGRSAIATRSAPRRARLGGAARALRRLDRPLLAGQREVRRLRRGLRLLRPVALRGGGHADARDDGARADARAREGGRGRRRAPLLHGHPGPGALEARLREGARGRPPGRRAHQPQALRVDRPHLGRPRAQAARRRDPARPPQRRDGPVLLRRGLDDGPLRGPHPDHRRDQGGRARDLRRRHPQPRRDARASGSRWRSSSPRSTPPRCRSTCSTRAPGRSSATAS